jgi:hypothetical protein
MRNDDRDPTGWLRADLRLIRPPRPAGRAREARPQPAARARGRSVRYLMLELSASGAGHIARLDRIAAPVATRAPADLLKEAGR